MKSRNKILIFLLICLMTLTVCAVYSVGFGDSIDYDNDYSSGDSWGDGDSGDWGDIGWIFTGGFGGPAAIVVVAVVIILIIVSKIKGGKGGAATKQPIQMGSTARVDYASLQRLRTLDPAFSEAAILTKVSNMFVTIQQAWSDMDYEPVRPLMSNALYEQNAKQLEDKKARDEKNVSSEICVMEVKLESFDTDGHNEYLNVWLRVKLKDYVVRLSDPTVIVRGTPDKTYYLDYRWQLMRSAGSTTNAETDGVKTGECPNCGANINMNQSGKCPYCDTVISVTEYDWVLSKVDKLQQISR